MPSPMLEAANSALLVAVDNLAMGGSDDARVELCRMFLASRTEYHVTDRKRKAQVWRNLPFWPSWSAFGIMTALMCQQVFVQS